MTEPIQASEWWPIASSASAPVVVVVVVARVDKVENVERMKKTRPVTGNDAVAVAQPAKPWKVVAAPPWRHPSSFIRSQTLLSPLLLSICYFFFWIVVWIFQFLSFFWLISPRCDWLISIISLFHSHTFFCIDWAESWILVPIGRITASSSSSSSLIDLLSSGVDCQAIRIEFPSKSPPPPPPAPTAPPCLAVWSAAPPLDGSPLLRFISIPSFAFFDPIRFELRFSFPATAIWWNIGFFFSNRNIFMCVFIVGERKKRQRNLIFPSPNFMVGYHYLVFSLSFLSNFFTYISSVIQRFNDLAISFWNFYRALRPIWCHSVGFDLILSHYPVVVWSDHFGRVCGRFLRGALGFLGRDSRGFFCIVDWFIKKIKDIR